MRRIETCYIVAIESKTWDLDEWPLARDEEPNGKKNPNGLGENVPRTMDDECVGCYLCALVCPVDNCITMKQIDPGKPFETWSNRSKRLAAGT
jgi:ferredoxin